MKTLDSIKDEYAVKESYRNWNDLLNWCHDGDENTSLNFHINEVVILAQKQALQNASEFSEYDEAERILNENNIVK